jgi:hypothetical protein
MSPEDSSSLPERANAANLRNMFGSYKFGALLRTCPVLQPSSWLSKMGKAA